MIITRILLALIYVQNSITMPHLVVKQLMRVIKWPRSHSHGNCVNKKGRGYKGLYSIQFNYSIQLFNSIIQFNYSIQLFNSIIQVNYSSQLFKSIIQLSGHARPVSRPHHRSLLTLLLLPLFYSQEHVNPLLTLTLLVANLANTK